MVQEEGGDLGVIRAVSGRKALRNAADSATAAANYTQGSAHLSPHHVTRIGPPGS